MTEAEWEAGGDPQAMLAHVCEGSRRAPGRTVSYPVTDRQLGLLGCALLSVSTPADHPLVASAADFADGLLSAGALRSAWRRYVTTGPDDPAAPEHPESWVGSLLAAVRNPLSPMRPEAAAGLVRCVVGNPFRPYRVRWSGGPVPSLARAAYDGRDPGTGRLDPVRLAVLADALEDAGCGDVREACGGCDGAGWYNEVGPNTFSQTCYRCDGHGTVSRGSPILAHLRSLGPHVRGCWAVDLCLDKEPNP